MIKKETRYGQAQSHVSYNLICSGNERDSLTFKTRNFKIKTLQSHFIMTSTYKHSKIGELRRPIWGGFMIKCKWQCLVTIFILMEYLNFNVFT